VRGKNEDDREDMVRELASRASDAGMPSEPLGALTERVDIQGCLPVLPVAVARHLAQ